MASIRERNGKFNVIYSYTNEKGERKQKWETYETKAEAKRRKIYFLLILLRFIFWFSLIVDFIANYLFIFLIGFIKRSVFLS